MRSFYLTDPKLSPFGEYTSLKDAEKAIRDFGPGSYLIVEVVRRAHVEPIPESVKVVMEATRTRAPRDPNAPRKERKPRKRKGNGAPQTPGL